MLSMSGATPSAMHLLRGLGPLDPLNNLEADMRAAACVVLSAELSDAQWDQATAPIRFGGCNLRRIRVHAPVAHATSCANALHIALAFAPFLIPDGIPVSGQLSLDLALGPGSTNATFPTVNRFLGDLLRCVSLDQIPESAQQTASRMIEQDLHEARIARLEAIPNGLRDVARIRSACAKHSGTYLYASVFGASGRQLWLENPRFLAVLHYRLGLEIIPESRLCLMCAKQACDTRGDHALSCMHGGMRTRAHTALLDTLFRLMVAARMTPRLEPRPFPDDPALRIDASCFVPRTGQSFFVDVALVSALAPTHVAHAVLAPGGAATAYEDTKVRKYGAAANALPNATLVPFIFDTLGGFGARAQGFAKLLIKQYARFQDLSVSIAARLVMHELNFAAMDWVARLLLVQRPAPFA